MKVNIFLLLILVSIVLTSCKLEIEQSDTAGDENQQERTIYDKELAAKLGADDYGMKKYVIAFLKAGPNRDQDSLTAVSLQKAHLANIQKLAEEGKIVLAGPFLDDGEMRGIFIFDVESVEEAKKLTETDPAIKAGRLTMELYLWYGSAALKQVNQIHKKVAKTKF